MSRDFPFKPGKPANPLVEAQRQAALVQQAYDDAVTHLASMASLMQSGTPPAGGEAAWNSAVTTARSFPSNPTGPRTALP